MKFNYICHHMYSHVTSSFLIDISFGYHGSSDPIIIGSPKAILVYFNMITIFNTNNQ